MLHSNVFDEIETEMFFNEKRKGYLVWLKKKFKSLWFEKTLFPFIHLDDQQKAKKVLGLSER